MGGMGAAPLYCAGVGFVAPDYPGLRGRRVEQGRGRPGSTPHAVGRWRKRFVEHRIAGLGDMPRPSGPRTVTDEQAATVVKWTLESTPKNATHSLDAGHGPADGPVAVDCVGELADLRPAAAPHRDVQAVHGRVLHRQGPRRRRPLSGPARTRSGVLRRRKVAGPGSGPLPAGAAHDAWVPQRITHDYARAGTTTLVGSAWSSGGSPSCPTSRYGAASTKVSRPWRRTSAPGSPHGTATPSTTSGINRRDPRTPRQLSEQNS